MADASSSANPLSGVLSGGLSSTPSSVTVGSIDPYIQPYVNNMLSQTQGLVNTPMPAYTGQLTAGQSNLQNQAWNGLANLTLPSDLTAAGNSLGNNAQSLSNIGSTFQPVDFTNQNFDASAAQQYMNPYLQASLQPQLQLLNEQLGTQNNALGAKLAQAGAFGGGRQAVEESENALNNNLAANSLISQGYNTAYNNAMNQFNADQTRNLQTQQAQEAANQYGSTLGLQGLQAATSAEQAQANAGTNEAQYNLQNLNALSQAGGTQQAQNQAGLNAQYNQYLAQLQYPQQMLKLQQSMLQGLPVGAGSTYGAVPSTLQSLVGSGTGIASLLSLLNQSGINVPTDAINGLIQNIFGGTSTNNSSVTGN